MTDHSAHCLRQTSVAVVVPTRGDRVLKDIEAALYAQTVTPDDVLFIADRDGRGAGWARNAGIRQCHADFIAFLDDDCLPPADWLETMIAIAARFDADVVGGTYQETDPFLAERRARSDYPEEAGIDTGGVVGAGGNIMYSRRALMHLHQVDGFFFNENFVISQDWELIWRARACGFKVAYSPVRVCHLKRLSTIAYLKQQYGRGIGIYKLNELQKRLPGPVCLHKSLLWCGPQRSTVHRWAVIVWHKAIGPFGHRSFSRWSHFLRFWLGEKIQALGFAAAHLAAAQAHWKADATATADDPAVRMTARS